MKTLSKILAAAALTSGISACTDGLKYSERDFPNDTDTSSDSDSDSDSDTATDSDTLIDTDTNVNYTCDLDLSGCASNSGTDLVEHLCAEGVQHTIVGQNTPDYDNMFLRLYNVMNERCDRPLEGVTASDYTSETIDGAFTDDNLVIGDWDTNLALQCMYKDKDNLANQLDESSQYMLKMVTCDDGKVYITAAGADLTSAAAGVEALATGIEAYTNNSDAGTDTDYDGGM